MKKILLVVIVITLALPNLVKSQGCMESSSDDGVTVSGYIQPQYEFHQKDGLYNDESRFTFERARFGFFGNIPYDISYYAFLETSAFKGSGNPYLLDAFITYTRFGPWAKISLGQFKSPFGLELNTPCHKLHTVKRSTVVNDLTIPDRDLGLMVNGGNDTTLFKYAVALTNGTGVGAKDNNTRKDIAARLVVQPFEFLSFGGSYKTGKSKSAMQGQPEDIKTRFAAELQLKYNNFLMQGEYLMGEDDGSYTTGGGCSGAPLVTHIGSVNRNGYWAHLMYMTPWNLQPIVKFESYEPNADLDFDQKTVLTFGLNYFLNDWTRIQVNYLYSAEEVEIENDLFYFQVQVKF